MSSGSPGRVVAVEAEPKLYIRHDRLSDHVHGSPGHPRGGAAATAVRSHARAEGWCGGTAWIGRVRPGRGAATNKSELFNGYAQWGAFGGSSQATAAERDKQRKMVRYKHLVANLLIFHTVGGMTRALDNLAADGHGAAITPEVLAGTGPYLNEHVA